MDGEELKVAFENQMTPLAFGGMLHIRFPIQALGYGLNSTGASFDNVTSPTKPLSSESFTSGYLCAEVL